MTHPTPTPPLPPPGPHDPPGPRPAPNEPPPPLPPRPQSLSPSDLCPGMDSWHSEETRTWYSNGHMSMVSG